jgi:ABC-type multidrug transport system ATPase subunit
MHEPQVLFLDEPTTGLDPAARLFVWDRLRELRERGVTLVLTTHDMHEATELAERVAIMDHGKLLAIDTPSALVESLPGAATVELATDPLDSRPADEVLGALRALAGVEAVERVTPRRRQTGSCSLRRRPRNRHPATEAAPSRCASASTSPARRRCSSLLLPRLSWSMGSA